MSKKRIPFATGGWVDTHSSGDMPFGGEMVITKDQQKRLSDIINQPMPTKNVVTIDPERVKATLAANLLLDGIRDRLKEGYIVDLGPLGTLYPSVTGPWKQDADELALTDMTPKATYQPSDEINQAIKGATLSWATEKDEKEGTETPVGGDDNGGDDNGGDDNGGGELEG